MSRKALRKLIVSITVLVVLTTIWALFMVWSGTWFRKESMWAVTRSLKAENSEKGNEYWIIWEGKIKDNISVNLFDHKIGTEAFSPEITEYYDCSFGMNKLDPITFRHSNGTPDKVDETLRKACQTAIETIPHNIISIRAFQHDAQWYLFVKLNVNLLDPCELYRYDCTAETLTYMAQWDDVDVVGITILDNVG